MSKGLIFFCCSCAILLFTIINLSVGPIISGKVGYERILDSTGNPNDFSWGTANCKFYSDQYDKISKTVSGDALKYGAERTKDECYRKKGMHDMEYTSFIFNIVIGFVCALLGLLHFFDVKKEFVSKTGLIGLGCGIVGFIFSFVYVILNGLVYTTYYSYDVEYIYSPPTSSYNWKYIYKRDSDGVFAEKKTSFFECIYYDSQENSHALIAKYSDLIQKQYNYDKDLYNSHLSRGSICEESPALCVTYDGKIPDGPSYTGCTKLYVNENEDEIINKDISDRFLTTLLLSLFTCLANIGLGIFGFLLYRTPGEF